MTSLLHSVGKPEIGDRLIERLKCLELNSIFILIVFADINEVVCKLLIELRLEVILSPVGISAHASAVGHVVRAGIAESLKYRIRPFFMDFEQDFPLCLITVPMVLISRKILESRHLCPQSLSSSHVVRIAVTVLRVVASSDVVAEMRVVQSCRADEPSDDLVDFLIAPMSTHIGPPAERHSPPVEMLPDGRWADEIAERIDWWCSIDFVAEEPVVFDIRAVFIAIYFLFRVVAVGAQAQSVSLAPEEDICSRHILNAELGIVLCGVGHKGSVPRIEF